MPAGRTLSPIQGIQQNPLGVTRFEAPDVVNSAARAIQFRDMMKPEEAQPLNAAAVQLLKLQEEQRKAQAGEKIAQNEFALSVLSGVNSAEDWERAKGIMISRYPEMRQSIETSFPEYHPRNVELIRNALMDETQKLKSEELGIERYKAVTDRARAESEQYGRATERKKSELRGFAPGTEVMYHPESGEAESLGQVAFKSAAPEGFELFEDAEGNQGYIREGGKIPEGWTRVEKGPGVSVRVDTGNKLTTGVKTQLQKDIIKGSQNVQSFKKTGELFKPSYLTWWGKGDKEVAQLLDKAGLASKAQKRLLKERNKWFLRAKNDFIAFRKWATGVAGGEKELAEIATAFPDPVKNSPTQYQSNLQAIEQTTKEILKMNQDFLSLDIDMDMPIADILRAAQEVGIPLPPGTKVGEPGSPEETTLYFNTQGQETDKDGKVIE